MTREFAAYDYFEWNISQYNVGKRTKDTSVPYNGLIINTFMPALFPGFCPAVQHCTASDGKWEGPGNDAMFIHLTLSMKAERNWFMFSYAFKPASDSPWEGLF